MLIAQSFQYREHKIALKLNRLAETGTIHIDNKLVDERRNVTIDLLKKAATNIVDMEEDGNIYDISF